MKIQYKSEPLDVKSETRYLCFRIVPSELSLWKRIFKNPWRYAYTARPNVFSSDNSVHDCLSFLFYPETANDIASTYDTYEKITEFLTSELNKAEAMWNESQEKYYNQNDIWKF